MKKITLMVAVIILILSLCGCEKTHDNIEIYSKGATVFDNVYIDIKDGYFYESHEKFTVDENTVCVTVYFSKEEKNDDWPRKGGAE